MDFIMPGAFKMVYRIKIDVFYRVFLRYTLLNAPDMTKSIIGSYIFSIYPYNKKHLQLPIYR